MQRELFITRTQLVYALEERNHLNHKNVMLSAYIGYIKNIAHVANHSSSRPLSCNH